MRVGCRPIHRKFAKCNNDLVLGNVKDCNVSELITLIIQNNK